MQTLHSDWITTKELAEIKGISERAVRKAIKKLKGDGGRNGVGLSAGLRWAIGKKGSGEVSGKTTELKPAKITLNNHK